MVAAIVIDEITTSDYFEKPRYFLHGFEKIKHNAFQKRDLPHKDILAKLFHEHIHIQNVGKPSILRI